MVKIFIWIKVLRDEAIIKFKDREKSFEYCKDITQEKKQCRKIFVFWMKEMKEWVIFIIA